MNFILQYYFIVPGGGCGDGDVQDAVMVEDLEPTREDLGEDDGEVMEEGKPADLVYGPIFSAWFYSLQTMEFSYLRHCGSRVDLWVDCFQYGVLLEWVAGPYHRRWVLANVRETQRNRMSGKL